MNAPMLTVADIARRLALSEDHVRERIVTRADFPAPAFQIGRTRRWEVAHVEQWVRVWTIMRRGKPRPRKVEKRSVAGFVYVISNPAFLGYVKVGKAESVKERLAKFNCGCPNQAYRADYSLAVSNARVVETLVHKALRQYRAQGEWFHIDWETAAKAIEKAAALSVEIAKSATHAAA